MTAEAGAGGGRLIGIARRPARRMAMEVIDAIAVAAGGGLDGDHKGARFPNRGVTIIAVEDWRAAVATLTDLAGPVPLDWTVRRANLLLEGLVLPKARGAILRVGVLTLEVTAQCYPCRRMDEAHPGLLKALAPDWRGGVCCRVLAGGIIAPGDAAWTVSSPARHAPRLPG